MGNSTPMSLESTRGPVLTIHRSAEEIGGNCIEIAWQEHRILLDAGSPLDTGGRSATSDPVPASLDVSRPMDAVLVSHPHQDHYGLLSGLPASWPVWSGAPAEVLMRMTAALTGRAIRQTFRNYRAFAPFAVGPFRITPHLTDHSAFDAHMLLVEVGGKRILYSGDFRRSGRKAALVDRMLTAPPTGVDVLLLEGTTLGRSGGFPTESDLEEQFVTLFHETPGRVFVTWSAQNIDRTVTIYRACKRAHRTLVLDLYAIDVLERLSAYYDSLPRLGWPQLRAVVTSGVKWLYESTDRMNAPEFIERCCQSGRAFGAAKLESGERGNVIMLRPPLLKDYERKGVKLIADDAWVFSMWSDYLGEPEYEDVRRRFDAAGASFAQLHTSGHASPDELETFAARIAPQHLIPIHSFSWDQHLDRFPNVRRLRDGERFDLV